MKVKSIRDDTQRINDSVRMLEQKVKCNSCGAEYIVITYLDKQPTVSKEMLARLDNLPHT